MRKVFIAICCTTLFWAACKEKDLPISFGTTVVAGTDSTYKLASAPASALHNVLVEEFTGQDCSNCPAGHRVLDAIAAANPGRINIVSLYFVCEAPQAKPPPGAIYDFRDSFFATNLYGAGLYGTPDGLPFAGIDRTPYQSQLALIGSSLWGTPIGIQEGITDSVNLGVSSVYNTTTGVATITDTVTYTQNVSTKQSISIYIVEDSIIDKQADNTVLGYYDDAYVFNDVFRAMIATPLMGDPVLDTMATKPAGQVYWRKYTFATKGTKILNPAHCRVIVFVNDPGTGGDYRVLQSVQCRLE